MPISITLITTIAMAATLPQAHVTRIEHRGAAYEVSYEPQLQTRMKTVGLSAGPRPSTERCRWSADVQVRRVIRREGAEGGHERVLPAIDRIEGSRFGSCRTAKEAVLDDQNARLDRLRGRMAEVAGRDRLAVIADIDSVRGLAVN